MMTTDPLVCDGCGQLASAEHIGRRLRRLEWTTRWRPIHIGTLLLGPSSPESDHHFLYAAKFAGEAELALKAAGVLTAGRTPEAILAEFQRGGFFLTHVLECPSDGVEELLLRRVPFVAARIRRSLKPKRIVLISELPQAVAEALARSDLECPIFLGHGQTLASNAIPEAHAAQSPQNS